MGATIRKATLKEIWDKKDAYLMRVARESKERQERIKEEKILRDQFFALGGRITKCPFNMSSKDLVRYEQRLEQERRRETKFDDYPTDPRLSLLENKVIWYRDFLVYPMPEIAKRTNRKLWKVKEIYRQAKKKLQEPESKVLAGNVDGA